MPAKSVWAAALLLVEAEQRSNSSGALYAANNNFEINPAGNVITGGNVTAENFMTAGQLYVASGTFHVNGAGQITTASCGAARLEPGSVGFNSFGANALPSYDEDCSNTGSGVEGVAWPSCSKVTSLSFTAPANAMALVFVTVSFIPISAQPNGYLVDIFHTTYPGATIVGGDPWYEGAPPTYIGQGDYLPAVGTWTTDTICWEVYGITAGTTGYFNSTIIGNADNSPAYEPTNVNMIDQQVTYVLLPAL